MVRIVLLCFGVAAATFSLATHRSPISLDSAGASDVVEWQGKPGTVTPNITSGAGGRVILTWLEPLTPTGRYALRFAVREQGRWSEPGTIRESDRFFVNWADFASLVETANSRWVVHWLEKTAALPYAYHVMLAVSGDRGRTWSEPFRAHDDSTAAEHGFVALNAGPDGVDLVWLDGRNMTGEERGDMTIRTRSLTRRGRLSTETELDGRTCECCQAALARTAQGLIVAYRDRSPAEVRDIAVTRELKGRWRPPTIVAPDGWEHRACPVNGPALAADGSQVDLVWYTGVGDQNRVWLVRSANGGASFGERIRIDEGQTLGRVDVESLGNGSTLVAWLEGRSNEEAEWRVRQIGSDGQVGPSHSVATVSRARLAGFPRLTRTSEGVFMTYTATGLEGGVRVVRLAGIPTLH